MIERQSLVDFISVNRPSSEPRQVMRFLMRMLFYIGTPPNNAIPHRNSVQHSHGDKSTMHSSSTLRFISSSATLSASLLPMPSSAFRPPEAWVEQQLIEFRANISKYWDPDPDLKDNTYTKAALHQLLYRTILQDKQRTYGPRFRWSRPSGHYRNDVIVGTLMKAFGAELVRLGLVKIQRPFHERERDSRKPVKSRTSGRKVVRTPLIVLPSGKQIDQ